MVRRRLPVLLLCVCLLLASCEQAPVTEKTVENQSLTVYTSFYPIYALADAVCRGIPDLTVYCLADRQDNCLRSYELTDWDAALLSGADAVILGGRGLESFGSIIESAGIPVIEAMYNMPLTQRSEAEDEEDHYAGYDPWYFLSVEGAKSIMTVIAGGMAELDPDYTDLYARNLEEAGAKLEELRGYMAEIASGIDVPGAILMQEGLVYFAFEMGITDSIEIRREAGCDMSQTEFDEALAQMRESGYTLVLIERQAPMQLVRDLRNEGFTVCLIDILSDHGAADGFEGYLSAMQANADALADAVGYNKKQ